MSRHALLATLAVLGFLTVARPARAVNEDDIKKAIDRGVHFLKRLQQKDGSWAFISQKGGTTALVGLTLLECGVPAKDPAVQKAAAVVRRACLRDNATYFLSLAIMFLDRLGERADEPLIDSMVYRLMAGQDATWGWYYDCPWLPAKEARLLKRLLEQRSQVVARTEPPKAGAAEAVNQADLAKETQARIRAAIRRLKIGANLYNGHPSDNSNTQFATLALWVARRHGLPVDLTLAGVDRRFRAAQRDDGGWGYAPTHEGHPWHYHESTPSMTCAGLIGLAVGKGVYKAVLRTKGTRTTHTAHQAEIDEKRALRDRSRERKIRAGLLALATCIGHPVGANGPLVAIGAKRLDCYFLWSLERVAVIYDLKTIGDKDWYAWGAELLLTAQGRDSDWRSGKGIMYDAWRDVPERSIVDTCFALLFLRRANVAKDLTFSLKAEIRDPGEVKLKTGGTGGDALHDQGPRPAAEPRAKPAQKPQATSAPGRAAPSFRQPGPDAEVDVQALADRLGAELLRAPPAQRSELINRLQQGKGSQYTQALAVAIPKLSGETREKARDALAERLARMKATTLHAYLTGDDRELRSAAALASAMKEDKSLLPDLIDLLRDADSRVRRAAHVALTTLTGKDFGPAPKATRAERDAAATRWKAWWQAQHK